MTPIIVMLLLTSLAGLAMPLGAVLARVENIAPEWLERELRHSVIAFGGGVLLAAVALVLVPTGIERLHWGVSCAAFVGGGLTFLGLDILLARAEGSASQLIAMLADFVPEAIALGAGFATGEPTGVLLAILIALQNLPEGFNAYRELRASTGLRPAKIVLAFTALAMLGPISGLSGYFLLGDRPEMVAGIMLFAGGGILYLTFEDIAPQAKVENRYAPAMGAVLGFMLGMVGHMLTVAS
ncbi:MAG: divalent cation transporter [Phycisphaeraceae bacterium]|nr:hypothetical protein [Phycisphaerales bacterium]MCB9843527.1 divalent cation transporter [Phycisphaeraceae bacterium]